MDEERPVSIFKYRGVEVPIYFNDAEQAYWGEIDGKPFSFGMFNADWKEDLYYLIDKKLDTILEFTKFPGAALKWFFNGRYRDIKLIYRGRVIKIFLVNDESEITKISISKIYKESLKILQKLSSKK